MNNFGPKKITLNEVSRGTNTVVTKEHLVIPLSESSLNQMMEHGKTGMIIISACRSAVYSDDPELSLGDQFERWAEKTQGGLKSIDSDALYDIENEWLRERNARADKSLRNDIQAAGYSYTPVYGGYKGKDDGKETFEPSYVVYNYKRGSKEPGDFEELRDLALKLCKKYSQESVYVQAPGEPPVYLDANGDQINSTSSDNFKFNDDNQEYFTTAHRDKRDNKRFTADIQFESIYIPLRPASYNERLRRNSIGEYIL